ncbi:MAG: extracellular solute-binding protein [Planctomycetes bacterium]|nr:extracellular solute-binding protein [Planctomycetota bacterium]
MTRHKGILLGCIAAGAVVLVVLAGCGKVGQRYTTIEWSTSYFEKYYSRWMDDFCRAHADENVRINFRAMVANAQEKVYTMLISHTVSDVIIVGTSSQALLLENDALEPVPDGFIDRDDFMPISLSVPTYPDGTLAAIPSTVGIRPFIYFNRDCMKEANTSEKDVPESYDEYRKWASKFFKWDVGKDEPILGPLPPGEAAVATLLRRPLGITRGHVPSAYPFFLAYMEAMPDENGKSDNSLDDFLGGPPGDRPLTYDTPEFIKGLAEWQKFFVSDDIPVADGKSERLPGLTSGYYAGCEAGNWIFGEVFNIDMQVTALPHAPGKPPRLYMNASANGVSRESKHKRLAMEFARYIGDANQQIDAYYGHGYLPCRFSVWKQLDADDRGNAAVRNRFLEKFGQGHGDFVGKPRIERTYHDSMTIYLWAPLMLDREIAGASSWETESVPVRKAAPKGDEKKAKQAEERVRKLADKYAGTLKKLADDVAEATGQRVTVILQGTPENMLDTRSVIPKSPAGVYTPLLSSGVYLPVDRIWGRLQSEVLGRAIQFVTADDPSKRMSPEEAGRWCQAEAEAILSGKK